MSISTAFQRLATIVAGIEADGVEVRGATIPREQDTVADEKVHVTLDLSIALSDTNELSDLEDVTDSGAESTVTAQHATDQSPEPADAENATDQDDPETAGSVVCPEPDCEKTFESEPGMKIHRTKIHLREEETDESATTPAYRDPEKLEALYEAHDSFPDMREALDVEVSAQTIRRQMIRHGIHDPSGEREDADGAETDTQETDSSAEQPTGEDGDPSSSDLPETVPLSETLPAELTVPGDLTLRELKEAVRTADTLYEIQQEFGLDREQTRELLGYLDLLELVHGRVATKHEREELKAEIDSRIRHSIESTSA